MPEVRVRKKFTAVEEIFHEGGPVAPVPLRRAAALAVIRNPFAGAYVKEIAGFMEDLKPLGLEMARSLVAALGGDAKVVGGYGKGAIVGAAGNSSMAPCGMCRAATPCVRSLEMRKRSWLQPRKWAGLGRGSMCPSHTSTLRT